MGIFFRPALLDEAYASVTGRFRANVALPHIVSRADATLARFCEVLKDEVSRPEHPAQNLLVESVVSAMALHLVREFALRKLPHAVGRGSLQSRQLTAVMDYIDEHPHQLLSLGALANIAGISRFHFSRLFKQSVGISAMQYVERRRLAAARTMMVEGRYSLSEVATATGLSDQSHFSRSFKRYFGRTPARFASLCRIASLEMLPDKVVASSEMLPGGRATMMPSKLRRHHEDEDDACSAGRTG